MRDMGPILEKVKNLEKDNLRLMGVNQHLEIELADQKAITELAVKALEEELKSSVAFNRYASNGRIENVLSKIERLTHAQT